MSIDMIHLLREDAGTRFVPPTDMYEIRSEHWTEAEFHCFTDPSGMVLCGTWSGEAGTVSLGQWPYDEVCILQSGRVALESKAGGRREFGTGDAFIVPRTFSGTWETIEPARKVFVAIKTPSLQRDE